MAQKKYKFDVDISNIRLDVFLVNHFNSISRNKIQKLIISGNIKVDSFIVKPSFILKAKECITIDSLELDKPVKYIKENIPLDIVYEDDNIVVINKQSGLVVHPGAGNLSGTLLNGLMYHFESLSSVDFSRPGIKIRHLFAPCPANPSTYSNSTYST